ncbi:MAG: YdcF family protein [Candidatus Acidiferrum sp.]|jgi:uncharacterized SAM-binding protein YcdF (DUF218 family)
MVSEKKAENSQSKPKKRAWILLGVAVVVLLATTAFILGVGRWLVVEDPLEKAQAIAVLSGHMPLRAMEAARLYREGYAPKIWLTHSTEPGLTLAAMGISYTGEDTYDTQVLIHEGVPPDAIRVLEPPIINTADELAGIAKEMANEKSGTVIVVTSKVHTRRVRTLWRHVPNPKGRALVRAAYDDPFQPSRWWRTTGDALDVVREVLGILNAWAGTPLHPAN